MLGRRGAFGLLLLVQLQAAFGAGRQRTGATVVAATGESVATLTPPPQPVAAQKHEDPSLLQRPEQVLRQGILSLLMRKDPEAEVRLSAQQPLTLEEALENRAQRQKQAILASSSAGNIEIGSTRQIGTIQSLSVWCFLVAVTAYFYKMYRETPHLDLQQVEADFQGQGFKHGPFDCLEDREVCCWSCWCLAVRWADTHNAAGVLSFWLAIGVFLTVAVFAAFAEGALVWVAVALLFAHYRRELRRRLNMKSDGDDAVKDFVLWCCCSCCAAVQEARQVKAARKLQDVPV